MSRAVPDRCPMTVTELCDLYQTWADARYRKPTSPAPGSPYKPTGEAYNIRDALKPLRKTSGGRKLPEVRAEDLCACQAWMIEAGPRKLSMGVINARINRIRRMFKWATKPPQRWLPLEVLTDLRLVEPLRPGETPAPVRGPVEPVAWEDVCAVIACADLELATMIELQWLTGMRPGELTAMRRCELTVEGDLLVYRPWWNKSSRHRVERDIPIGPMGRGVLDPWLGRLPPGRERVWRFRASNGYYQAIRKVMARHNLKQWFPYQIRHAYGTRIRAEAGMEAAQINLGHKHASTTEIYAKPDTSKGRDAAKRFG